MKKPPIWLTLFRVWRVWRRAPELRLGQLVCSVKFVNDCDPFYVYDEDLPELLERLIGRIILHFD